MSKSDPWVSKSRARRGAEEGARQSLTLGEWLDAMSSEDRRRDRTPPPARREADESSWSDVRGNDQILRSALAELDARERRIERRTDDMMDALGRFMDKGDRSPRSSIPDGGGEERLDATLDQIDRRLEDIAGRIEQRLQARVDRAAPTPDLDARLADIARRLDSTQTARRHDGPDTERLARLETSLDMLVRRLDRRPEPSQAALNGPRRRVRPNVENAAAEIRAHQIALDEGVASRPAANDDLGDRLAAIADRLEAAQARAIGPAVDTMRSDIAALAAKLDSPRPPVDLAPLNQQLDSLRRAVIAAMTDRPEGPDLSPIQDQIASLSARLQTPQASADLALIREQIGELATRLESPSSVDLSPLQQQMTSLGQAITSAMRDQEKFDPAQILDGLELRVDAARGRIANDVRSQIQAAIVELRHALESQASAQTSEPLARAVQELSARFDAHTRRDDRDAVTGLRHQIDALKGLEHHVKALAQRFDRLEAEPATAIDSSQLEGLAAEMRNMAREIAPASAVAKIEHQLLALEAKLDDVKNRPFDFDSELRASAPDLTGVEAMISSLADRIEAARSEQTNAAQFHELQAQVRQLADKLDRTDAAPALSVIERAVTDLFTQIDSLKHDRDHIAESVARKAAEAAAREAADDALRRATLDLANAARHNPRLDALTQDVDHLRRDSELIDRKTHDTLEAIHTALEKIVDRLGSIERERPQPATAYNAALAVERIAPESEPFVAPPPKPAQASAPAARTEAKSYADADVSARLTGRRQAPIAIAAPEKPAAWERLTSHLPFLHRGEAPKTAPESPSEQPSKFAAPAGGRTASEPDLPLEPGTARPSPKAAPDPAAALKAQLVAAARRASQIATDEANKTRAEAKSPEGNRKRRAANPEAAAKSRLSFLENRKKPILMTLAALLLAVIAFNVLSPVVDEASKTTRIQERVSSPTPSSSAPVPPAAIPGAAEAPATATPVAPDAPASSAQQPPAEPRTETAPSDIVGSVPKPDASIITMPAPSLSAGPDVPPGIVSPTLRAAALRGDPAAAHEIGVRLIDGRGVPRDPKAALRWFERAANEGLAPAQFRVGNMLEKGVGAARDPKLAKSWYERAAAKGNAKALHNLGVLIAEGGGGRPDYAAAADNFLKAAKLGVRDSQYNVAILYARGLGVGPSMPEAFTWLSIAANQGDEEAGKKRDEIAGRLTPEELQSARAAVQAFKPATPDRFANEVAAERDWDAAPAAPQNKTKAARPEGMKI